MPISFKDFKKRLNTVEKEVVDKAVSEIDNYFENKPDIVDFEYSTKEIAERDALWWDSHPGTEQALLDAYSERGLNASMEYRKPGSSWDSFTYILFKLEPRD